MTPNAGCTKPTETIRNLHMPSASRSDVTANTQTCSISHCCVYYESKDYSDRHFTLKMLQGHFTQLTTTKTRCQCQCQ